MKDDLIARLRSAALSRSEALRMLAEAKSLRQESNHERRTDLYAWPAPSQTPEGRAADEIERLRARVAELEATVNEMAGV